MTLSHQNDMPQSARTHVIMVEQAHEVALDDRHLSAAVLQVVRDQLIRRERINEHRHEAGTHRTEDRCRVLRCVVHQ
jgi:hypothetical protein